MVKPLFVPVLLAATLAVASASFPSSVATPTTLQDLKFSRPGGLVNRLRGGADFVEKVTGLSFKETISEGGKTLTLVGAGDRKKAIVGPIAVNVYAVGLYVDEAGAKATAATTPDAAQKAILDGTFTKSLKIVMARSVPSQKIGDALAEQIEPRVKGTSAPMDSFKTFFGGMDKLDKNNEIVFTANGDSLSVTGPSASKDFASKDLCHAMFDIYLGGTPVSPNGKKSMLDGFVKLCA